MYKNAKYKEGFDFMKDAKNSMNDASSKMDTKKLDPEEEGGFFSKISKGSGNVSKSFLGPTHNYAKEILSPQELGMSDTGNMTTLGNNISGIIAYTDVLVSGKSSAQQNCVGGKCSPPCDIKSGRNCSPLGNAFYLETGGKCKGPNGNLHTRHMYINNKPTGAIPFISDMTGKNTPGLRGLIPGAIENLGHINPLAMFSGFMQGTNPPCRPLKLEGEGGNGKQYVADADIADLDPCLFGGRNPVSGNEYSGCADGFQNINDIVDNDS